MKRIGSQFLLLIFLVVSFVNKAYSAQIKTLVSDKQVQIGDVFTVSVSVSFSGSTKPNLSIFEIPKDEKISFLRQSDSYRAETSFSNGKMSSKKTMTLNIIYYAKKKGLVNIPAIKLKINDRVFKAKGFRIKILEKSASSGNRGSNKGKGIDRNDPFARMESLFNNFLNQAPGIGSQKQNLGDLDFFIDVETSNMFPYISELFVTKWYLYTNGRVTDIDTLKYPTLEGFWKDEIELSTSLVPEDVEKNGKVYTRYLLASYALTPIVSDLAMIDPYEIKCQIIGGFFRLAGKELIRKSDEAIIRINPLPSLKPENFTGAVGNYSVSSYVKDQSFKVGQPFTYIVKYFGDGQLKFMELPELTLDQDQFEIYDTTDESKFMAPISSSKTYKILVVPRKEGKLTLPSHEVSFFNAEKSKFYTVKTKPVSISVAPGSEVVQDIVKVEDQKTEFTPEVFSSISQNSSESSSGSSFYWYLVYLASLMLSFGLLLVKFLNLQMTYDFDKDLKNKFKVLEKKVDNGHWKEASVLAVNIVYLFANNKTKRKPKSQRLEDILAVLPSALRRDIEISILDLNSQLQRYSFAPESLINTTNIKEEVLKKCLALKALLERSSEHAKNN